MLSYTTKLFCYKVSHFYYTFYEIIQYKRAFVIENESLGIKKLQNYLAQ